MPDIRIELTSQRKRRVDDKVSEAEFKGTHFVHPLDVKKGRGFVLADLVPGQYTGMIRVDGFKPSRRSFRAKTKQNTTLNWPMDHRCTLLPGFGDLEGEQKRLLRSVSGSASVAVLWRRLGDNQACTFFPVTYALARTPIGGTVLSDYIQTVKVIGGAEIEAPVPNGRKKRRAVGWRMHVVIKPKFRKTIANDLVNFGFKKDSGTAHTTHSRFGYVTSFRQKGRNPRLQVVLNKDCSGADVDLDNGVFHRSAPHDVYKALKKKFPAVRAIYQVK